MISLRALIKYPVCYRGNGIPGVLYSSGHLRWYLHWTPGCGCSAIRRSSLGGVPGQRWHAGRGRASQGKLTLADTAYASEKPVCAVDLTLPGCLDLTCSMSRRLAVFDKKEEARLTEEPVNVASTDPARGDCLSRRWTRHCVYCVENISSQIKFYASYF